MAPLLLTFCRLSFFFFFFFLLGQLNTTIGAQREADQTERIIQMQKDEIRRLRESVRNMETSPRPPSGGRLPPVTAQ